MNQGNNHRTSCSDLQWDMAWGLSITGFSLCMSNGQTVHREMNMEEELRENQEGEGGGVEVGKMPRQPS